ncbi:MAG: hypothetical protein LKKZDAJK_002233 [Candidatus Fervidibacter sp.]
MNAVADVGKVTLALAGPPLLATLLRRWFVALGVSATNPWSVLAYTVSQILVFFALCRLDSFSALYHGRFGRREAVMAIGYWLIAFSAWYPLSLLAKSLGIPTESSWGWWQRQGLWFLPIALWATGAAFFEEGFFRGYAIPKLTNLLRSPLMALLLSSVAFGLLHGRFGLFLSVYTALFGLIVGTLYLQTRSTWACFAFHLVNNWVVDFIVYGVIIKK